MDRIRLFAFGYFFLFVGVVISGLMPQLQDEQGRLNQALAAACDHVVFMAAGLPLVMKGNP